MINAEEYGFRVGNNPELNSKALQLAVSCGGDIHITAPGVYDISQQIIVGSNTTLYFGAGVTLRRHHNPSGKNGFAFINSGALTGDYNENIKIIGLKLICNGVESTGFGRNVITAGLRSQLAFMYVRNLEIRDFQCSDIMSYDYAIQISMFENVSAENLIIEGEKGGICFGSGKRFTLRHAGFKTSEAPVSLNNSDGSDDDWIEEGVFEDCYDLNGDIPVFICSNAAVDNIRIINSDISGTVMHLQNIKAEGLEYPDTKVLISGTAFRGNGGRIITCDESRSATVKIVGSLADDGFRGTYKGNVKLPACDIELIKE